jgi:multiple antibiotic resistance protein
LRAPPFAGELELRIERDPRMPVDYLVSAFVTLLLVVDPVGLAPTFLAVTHGLPAQARKRIGLRASIIAGLILFGTALVGDWLLHQLGIGVPAFRIAGGLLLFMVATEMVLGVRNDRQTRQAEEALEEHVRNIAAFPLAIPLMAGPGAITATLLLAGQASGKPVSLAVLFGVIIVVMAACWLAFLLASRIEKLLGVTGNAVLSRLLGVILAALAVQYVIDGLRTALTS